MSDRASKKIPFVAISPADLGEPIGKTIRCLKCPEVHPVEESKPPGLSFVRCKRNLWLVGVDGKELRK